jgi:hypothetical protein
MIMACSTCVYPGLCAGSYCAIDGFAKPVVFHKPTDPEASRPGEKWEDYVKRRRLMDGVTMSELGFPSGKSPEEMADILRSIPRREANGKPVPVTVIPKLAVNITFCFLLAFLSFCAGAIVGSRGNRPDNFHVRYVPPACQTIECTDPKY